MKQFGNLAVVCAKRSDGVLLQILDGKATVFLGVGSRRTSITVDWHDDNEVSKLIFELNYGKFREEEITKQEAMPA